MNNALRKAEENGNEYQGEIYFRGLERKKFKDSRYLDHPKDI